jgi:hypothetical protein
VLRTYGGENLLPPERLSRPGVKLDS